MADTGSVRLSVPGKVILMGEHAAVYGRPAVVAAVDLRLEVEASLGERIRPLGRGRVTLDLPDIDVLEESTWQEVEAFTDDARRRWRAYEAGCEPFRSDREQASLVRIAVGEALASLTPAASARLRERSLDLRLRSAIPVGAGLGSSAAAAVGVVAAVRAVSGGFDPAEPERVVIENVALEVERRQHGFPSGIDTGTVLRGGVVLVRRTGGAQRFDDLPRPEWLRLEIGIVDSGAPDQTTGAVVTTVRRRYEEDREQVGAVLDRIGEAVESFRVAVVTDRLSDASAAVAAAHRALVDLGVVPPAVAERIARVEAAGGVAKISGAGALDGESAGALVYMLGGRDAGTVEGLSDLVAVDAPIGGDGLRFED
ncbi:MAG: hypothetical protein OXG81_01865 [Acidobacteria bacterium]|nr:hypothetical protein [Acidobacteriota bacterium]